MSISPFSTALGAVKRIHFIGIGGVGMCGIAEVLAHEGYEITGSDQSLSTITDRLATLGVSIFHGHSASNVSGVDVVVVSSAIDENNEEIIAARAAKLPVIPRAAMLAEIMRYRYGIAVSGTHGKTTTTSLIAHILAEVGLDPSFVIGGKLTKSGKGAKLGESKYLVVEADESDASFLYLKPMMAVVTNIDLDHMQTYNEDVKRLDETFVNFLHHLPFYGVAALCIDDPGVDRILPMVERPVVTYGFSEDADVQAIDWKQQELCSRFTVKRKAQNSLQLQFSLPGKHNVQNVLAAVALLQCLPIEDAQLVQAIASFEGVGRRFQLLGNLPFTKGHGLVIDDYGHHPTEIGSTFEAIKEVWPARRSILVFQPHRYSRTKSLFKDFVKVLAKVDNLILLDVYAAGEPLDNHNDHLALAKAIQEENVEIKLTLATLTTLETILDDMVEEGDVIMLQGAGSIGKAARALANRATQVKVLS